MRGEDDGRCTSRQRNTHSTESRDVRYPWHPWFGRSVTVYEALTKGGHAICRCGFEDQRNDRSLEVPAWMFESAACDHLRLTATPFVDCQALIELKAVLQTAPRADVLQAPHHCPPQISHPDRELDASSTAARCAQLRYGFNDEPSIVPVLLCTSVAV